VVLRALATSFDVGEQVRNRAVHVVGTHGARALNSAASDYGEEEAPRLGKRHRTGDHFTVAAFADGRETGNWPQTGFGDMCHSRISPST